ncbi:MAG: arginase family protein, partial [Candidatus Omnitrophota bacterium]
MDNKDQAAPVPNFGDLPEEYSNSKRSKIVIIPAPYEASTSYNTGTKKGPRAVIEASRHMETFDDELNQETFKNGIHTREPLNLDGLSPEDMIKNLSAVVKELAQSGKLPVVLGGEHTVSIAPVTALKELHPELSVLYLDAHYDLRDELGGNRLSHACVARRISEIAPLVEVGLRSS